MKAPNQALLTQLLDYDPKTGILLWRSRPPEMFSAIRYQTQWNTRYAGQQAFTATNRYGYKVGAVNNKVYRACRIIIKLVYNLDPENVDHIDGNRQNDSLENLRPITARENQLNMRRGKANNSGIIGVCWDKQRQKWTATITVHRKTINLGRFDDKQEAIQIRQQAEKDHGFHANHGR